MPVHVLKYPPAFYFEPRVFTCVQEVFFACSRHACIGLHADRFVIRGNHLGRALTPFYLVMTVGQSQYS